MRRVQVDRRTTTLMYAGSNRRSAMRRMVPLTNGASRSAPESHSWNGDLPCCGGAPAHGEVLAHLRATKRASWTILLLISCGHLGPEEAGELTGDGGDHYFA